MSSFFTPELHKQYNESMEAREKNPPRFVNESMNYPVYINGQALPEGTLYRHDYNPSLVREMSVILQQSTVLDDLMELENLRKAQANINLTFNSDAYKILRDTMCLLPEEPEQVPAEGVSFEIFEDVNLGKTYHLVRVLTPAELKGLYLSRSLEIVNAKRARVEGILLDIWFKEYTGAVQAVEDYLQKVQALAPLEEINGVLAVLDPEYTRDV